MPSLAQALSSTWPSGWHKLAVSSLAHPLVALLIQVLCLPKTSALASGAATAETYAANHDATAGALDVRPEPHHQAVSAIALAVDANCSRCSAATVHLLPVLAAVAVADIPATPAADDATVPATVPANPEESPATPAAWSG